MQLVSTPRIDFLRGLRDEFVSNYGFGRRIIGVEGFPGSGAGALADDLSAVFDEGGVPAFRASLSDFLLPKSSRGAREGAYDESTFRRVLLDPWRLAGSTGFQTSAFDADRDVPALSEWRTAPADAVLIVDGAYLLGSSLKGIWHFLIYVDAQQAEGDQAYLAETSPFFSASAVIDTSNPELPKRVLSDSC
jgi:uridine kinase